MNLESYIIRCMSTHRGILPIVRHVSLLLCLCTLAITYSGCAKVKLIDFWDVTGHLIITPDNSTHTLPALKYHFYNTPRYGAKDESLLAASSCDGSGNYSGNLPMGTYRTIAVCTQAEHTILSNLDSCDLATVNIPALDTPTRNGETLYPQPGDVYAVALNNFVLHPGDTVRHTPEPTLLTKYIQLTLSMNGELYESLTEAGGMLRGITPCIQLFSCASVHPDPTGAPLRATEFTAFASDMNTWKSSISIFDICNPMYGSAYTNILSLSFYSTTEGREELDVDISGVLSDAIADNGGTLPLVIPIEIKIVRGYVGLESEVVSWEESGDSEHVVPRP